jgi:hypothetical protein
MKYLAILFLVLACGKDATPPAPGTTFVVTGKFIEVKGTVKTVTVEGAKAVVGLAVKTLEK